MSIEQRRAAAREAVKWYADPAMVAKAAPDLLEAAEAARVAILEALYNEGGPNCRTKQSRGLFLAWIRCVYALRVARGEA